MIAFKNTITDLFRGIYTEFLTGSADHKRVFRRAYHELPSGVFPRMFEVYQARLAFLRSLALLCVIWGAFILWNSSKTKYDCLVVFIAVLLLGIAGILYRRALQFWDWGGEAIFVSYAAWLSEKNKLPQNISPSN